MLATQSLVSFTFIKASSSELLAFFSLSFSVFISPFSFLTAFSGSVLFSSSFSSSSSALNDLAKFSAALEQTASIRLTPALTPLSFVMKNDPISSIFFTCVPPQSSLLTSPKLTTLTLSAYFSLNSAIAPLFLASSSSITCVFAFAPSKIHSFTRFSTFKISSLVSAFG